MASGAYDFALAIGVEKLKDIGYGGLPEFSSAMGTFNQLWMANFTAPGGFAMMATSYAAKYASTSTKSSAPWPIYPSRAMPTVLSIPRLI